MKRALQILALAVALTAALFWAAAGAQRGWTKTSVPVKSVDVVTGIEATTYTKHFVPGIDFLAVGLLSAGILAGASLMFRDKKLQPSKSSSTDKPI